MNKPELKIPNELTVTINVPHIDSMKLANLDINENSLVFEYPNLYYLDLNLKYKCNQAKGHAKFDKSKKSLTIRVPVEGLTEDSQRAFEENFKTYTEKRDERMKKLLDITESVDGQSAPMLIPDSQPDAKGGNVTSNNDVDEEDDDEQDESSTKDEVKRGREQFLQIYKEDANKDEGDASEDSGPKEIKFRREQQDGDLESETGQRLKIGNEGEGKPMIQEIKSTTNAPNKKEVVEKEEVT